MKKNNSRINLHWSHIALLFVGCVCGVLGTIVVLQFAFFSVDSSDRGSSNFVIDSTADDRNKRGRVQKGSSSSGKSWQGISSSDFVVSDNPFFDWKEIVSDETADILQREILIQIASSAVDTGGLEALMQLLSEVDVKWEQLNQVISTVVHSVASGDPQESFGQALSFSLNDGGALILREIVKVWGIHDPQTALAEISSLERRDLREFLQSTLLDIWIATDPGKVLQNLEMFPERIQDDVRFQAIVSLRKTVPGDALKQLSETTERRNRYQLALELVEDWALEDSEAALNWALSDPDIAEMRNQVIGRVILVIASEQPNQAMQIALTHTKENKLDGEYDYDAMVIMQLVNQNIDQALSMVSQVKDTSKFGAYQLIGDRLYHDGEYQRAIDLGKELSTNNQKAKYYQSLMNRWAVDDSRTLLKRINEFSSPETKSAAASALIGRDWFKGTVLTTKQREDLKLLLTEEDAKRVRERFPEEDRRRVTE